MLLKNKSKTFAVKLYMSIEDNLLGIKILPMLNLYIFNQGLAIDGGWLIFGFEFWFANVKDLI